MDPLVDYSKFIPISINDEFMKSLYNYLHASGDKCRYKLEETNYNVKNCKDIIVGKKISDIVINVDGVNIYMKNDINIYLNVGTNSVESYSIGNADITMCLENKKKSLLDFVTEKQKEIIQKIIE